MTTHPGRTRAGRAVRTGAPLRMSKKSRGWSRSDAPGALPPASMTGAHPPGPTGRVRGLSKWRAQLCDLAAICTARALDIGPWPLAAPRHAMRVTGRRRRKRAWDVCHGAAAAMCSRPAPGGCDVEEGEACADGAGVATCWRLGGLLEGGNQN